MSKKMKDKRKNKKAMQEQKVQARLRGTIPKSGAE